MLHFYTEERGDTKETKRDLCSFVGIFLLVLLCYSGYSHLFAHSFQQVAFTTVSVSPSPVTAFLGQNLTINVTVSSVQNLYGWEFRMSWNVTLLDALNVVQGPFLRTGGETFFAFNVNQTNGSMIVDCTLLGNASGVNGDGTLATINFFVEDTGQCPLDLYSILLLDFFEHPISCEVADGYGYFVTHDVAVAEVDVSPNMVIQGDSVNVSVTVQNEGQFTETFNVSAYANSRIIGVQPVSLDSGSSTIVLFIWGTADFEKGDYNVSASASILQDEVDITDNSKMSDSLTTVLYLGHDVAIAKVEPAKTVAGQGYNVSVSVTAKNFGIFEETFDVALVANATTVRTLSTILASGNTAVLVFVWNTSDYSKGGYVISAQTSSIVGEADTSDNDLTAEEGVFVTIPGDTSGDFKVGPYDLAIVIASYGSDPYPPNQRPWNPNADINSDGKVGPFDLAVLIANYGQHYP